PQDGPKVDTIAEEPVASRAPVREALRTLGDHGLVTPVPRVGSVVNAFTPETVVHVYSLRAVIECWLVAESVRLMTDEVRAELPRIIDQMEAARSEEHTSELQSRENLVCRLLLEKKKA